MNIKKHGVEFFGTFILTLAILTSLLVSGGITTPLTAGITLGLLVFMLGSFTSVHVNPAITVAFLVFKKIDLKEAGFRIMAQFAGAALALTLVRLSGSASPIPNPEGFLDLNYYILLGEFVGTFFFAFGVASIAFKNKFANHANQVVVQTTDIAPSLVIGASLAIGIMLAGGLGSVGSLNPAVSFGIGTFSIWYIIAPIAGAILGMWLYVCFEKPEKEKAVEVVDVK